MGSFFSSFMMGIFVRIAHFYKAEEKEKKVYSIRSFFPVFIMGIFVRIAHFYNAQKKRKKRFTAYVPSFLPL